MTQMANTVVIAAHSAGAVLPETWDLAAFALELKYGRAEDVEILVLGEAIDRVAEEIAAHTGINVRAVFCPGLTVFSSEAYRAVLAREFANTGVSYICAPHNSQGIDYAPALAVSLNGACITGVNGLSRDGESVFFQKDVYGGKIKANMAVHADPAVLTVQPGVFRFESGSRPSSPGRVRRVESKGTKDRIQFLGVRKAPADTAGITEARVVVAVGRGILEQENMPLIHRLAEIFPKSAVAGTRIVCDRGWLPYNRQVGVTGAMVAPALYLACGISGASQHVMGMRGSRFVVAINTDPQAALFNEADICVVADITTFIPLLLDRHAERTNENTVQ